MTLQIRALDRGGWSVYGGGSYDRRANGVRVEGLADEEIAATVTFGENISSVAVTSNGISATTPTLSTTTASFELSNIDDGGDVELLFSLASGQKRLLRIYSSFASRLDDYGFAP